LEAVAQTAFSGPTEMNRVNVALLDYHVLILNSDCQSVGVHAFKARNCGDATKLVLHLIDRNAVELWEGPR
jgi:L-lactate utilization protein LutB